MKIGILTYYFVHNYGAVLQAYGMQRVLEDLGHEVTFLSFHRNYDHMPEGADRKYNLSLKSVPFLSQYLITNGAGTFWYNYLKKKQLDSFLKRNMTIGERYSDAKQDAVLIGSDEVFAIDVGVNPFLYGHGLPVEKVFSYAASAGSTQLEDIDCAGCRELIGSGLNKLSDIGVRDEVTQELVREISGREATLNCDPVILYGFPGEQLSARKNKPEEQYLLLYSYDRNFNDKKEVEKIRTFAQEHELKVWSVGYYHKWCDKNIMCSPLDALGLFRNAELVLTDTFHGSVISLITNAPFIVRLNKRNQKVEFLLKQYGVGGRRVSSVDEIDRLYSQSIDFEQVNGRIVQEREKSMSFLRECISK